MPGTSATSFGADAPPVLVPLPPEGLHCSPEQGCITCGDVALPLIALLVDDGRGLALCRDEQGRRETVEIALVGPVAAGDELLVHAGTAIAHLGTPAEARIPDSHEQEVLAPCR